MYSCWNCCGIDRLSFEEELMNKDDIRIFDWSALGITAASFMEWLPALSAGLSAIWFGLRIIQTLREMKHGRRD